MFVVIGYQHKHALCLGLRFLP